MTQHAGVHSYYRLNLSIYVIWLSFIDFLGLITGCVRVGHVTVKRAALTEQALNYGLIALNYGLFGYVQAFS